MIPLASVLVAGSLLVYAFRFELDEPRRFLMALATLGFFFAPSSPIPLRTVPWLLAVAGVAWGAQIAGGGTGGLPLWIGLSVAGALLVVRGGSRAARYYLPEAGSDSGLEQQRSIRAQLRIAVALFLYGYVLDGFAGAVAVSLSALFVVRYVLLQSKHLGIVPAPALPEPGLVPSQRWPFLALCAVAGATSLPRLVFGDDPGRMLVTGALVLVTASLFFVLSLTRTGWPRSVVRWASFGAGIVLAIAGTAVLVELEAWDRAHFRFFASFCMSFLVVLPFLRHQTKLFADSPYLASLVPPQALAAMIAPVTALGGVAGASSTSVFLVSFAVLFLLYSIVVARREGTGSLPYLVSSLALVLWLFFAGRGDRSVQVFFIALGFALYAVDRMERVWREERARGKIPSP